MNKQQIIKSIKQSKERVSQSLLANQSYLVSKLSEKNFEDIEFENINLTFEDALNYQVEIIDYLKNQGLISKKYQNLNNNIFQEYESEIKEFLNSETDYYSNKTSFYEAWLVDSWFLKKLEEKGELTINYCDNEQWWGRGTTGQSVFLDSVVEDIVLELAADYSDLEFSKFQNLLEQHHLRSSGLVCNIDSINYY